MSNGLSYASLTCVLEHMEANKRIRIASRSPNLKKIEKNIPLHLEFLIFDDSEITLNDLTYQLRTIEQDADANIVKDLEGEVSPEGEVYWPGEEFGLPYPVDRFGERDRQAELVMMPGDISLKTAGDLIEEQEEQEDVERDFLPMYSTYLQLNHVCNRSEIGYKKRLPNNLEFHGAMKKVTCFLLGDRPVIRVRRLTTYIQHQKILRLPDGLKIRVRELFAKTEPLEELSKIIDKSSYPLETIETWSGELSSFELPIVKTAKKLNFYGFNDANPGFWLDKLLKMPQKELLLYYSELSMDDYLTLIQSWLNNGREIGTRFTFTCSDRHFLMRLLYKARKQFNGVVGNKKISNPKGSTSLLQCVIVPMSSTTELCIYEKVDYESLYRSLVCIEVSPTGSSIPVKHDSWYSSMVDFFLEFGIYLPTLMPLLLPFFVAFIFLIVSFLALWIIGK